MSRHIIKLEYDNGVKLDKPVLWCSRKVTGFDFYFLDAQHAALSVDGSVTPCKSCIKAVIRELQKAL